MSSQTVFMILAAALLGCFVALRFAGKIAPDKARGLVTNGALLLDVRSEGEYANGHLEGAKNVPVADVPRRIGELESYKERPVIVYCASGVRSAMAKRTLVGRGFREVHDLGAMSRY